MSASITISLPLDFQQFAEAEVRAGHYNDVREVAHSAFERLLQWDVVVDEAEVPGLMEALAGAQEDLRHGRYTEGSPKELMDEIRRELHL